MSIHSCRRDIVDASIQIIDIKYITKKNQGCIFKQIWITYVFLIMSNTSFVAKWNTKDLWILKQLAYD